MVEPVLGEAVVRGILLDELRAARARARSEWRGRLGAFTTRTRINSASLRMSVILSMCEGIALPVTPGRVHTLSARAFARRAFLQARAPMRVQSMRSPSDQGTINEIGAISIDYIAV